jgi:ribonucleotide reductase beta subunit family protein with ferritin-like domain
LKPNPDRFAIHPITDRKLFDMYKKHQSAFWIPEEIDFSKDRDDWERLPKSAQFTLEHIFGYFAGADGIVNENLGTRILREVQSPEARCFYGFQFAMENIHGETYSLMLDTMIRDPTRKAELLRSIHADPIIARKGNWAQEWSKKGCFAECLLAFAVVEGTHFPGSFCSIFWLKRFNLMHGTTFSNELISKDEGLHTNFAAEMYRRLKRKLDEKHAHELVKGGINVEKAFIDYIYPEPFDCMNAKEVKEYVECITDRLLESLGYKKLYHTKNPYPWMDTIGMQGKTNFFEKRVGEYGKPGSVEALKKKISSVESEREPFSMDEDF